MTRASWTGDWALLYSLVGPHRQTEAEREEADRLRALRNAYVYGASRHSSLVGWTLSPAWAAIPVYKQPEPVSGVIECTG